MSDSGCSRRPAAACSAAVLRTTDIRSGGTPRDDDVVDPAGRGPLDNASESDEQPTEASPKPCTDHFRRQLVHAEYEPSTPQAGDGGCEDEEVREVVHLNRSVAPAQTQPTHRCQRSHEEGGIVHRIPDEGTSPVPHRNPI